ncbi:hypothetical protein RFI_06043, partial [Reticulomyxa filosa]
LLFEDKIKNTCDNQTKELMKLEEQLSLRYTQVQQGYEKQYESIEHDLMLQMKLQLHEIEERKNLHINDLINNHQNAFAKMRAYYNAITKDNLDLITALKNELEELEEKAKSHENRYQQISIENKKLSVPLEQVQQQVEQFRKKLTNYHKSLKASKTRLSVLDERLRDTISDFENLKHEFEALQQSKKELQKSHEDDVNTMTDDFEKRKTDQIQKILLLQQQTDQQEKRVDELVKQQNIDTLTLSNWSEELKQTLKDKNQEIEYLRFQVIKAAKVSWTPSFQNINNNKKKIHDDFARQNETKLRKLGIPEQDLQISLVDAQGSRVPTLIDQD